jgi:hypothetical protein
MWRFFVVVIAFSLSLLIVNYFPPNDIKNPKLGGFLFIVISIQPMIAYLKDSDWYFHIVFRKDSMNDYGKAFLFFIASLSFTIGFYMFLGSFY